MKLVAIGGLRSVTSTFSFVFILSCSIYQMGIGGVGNRLHNQVKVSGHPGRTSVEQAIAGSEIVTRTMRRTERELELVWTYTGMVDG
jgi:hypothetical protein